MYISIGTNGCINRFNGYIDLDDRRISYSIDLPQTPSPEFIQNTDLTIGNKRLEGLLKVTFIEFFSTPLSELLGIMAFAEDEEKLFMAARIGIGFSRDYSANDNIEEFLRGCL
ncbi:MAG: hypothetical protein AABW52_04810 [Nanoarchaeota archaeon]